MVVRRYDFTKMRLGESAMEDEGRLMLHDNSQLYDVSSIIISEVLMGANLSLLRHARSQPTR